jgi:hypothetical protein
MVSHLSPCKRTSYPSLGETYLHYAFVAKVRNWWLRSGLDGKDHQDVVNMLAKAIAQPNLSRNERLQQITSSAVKLRKRELVLRMKRQAADDD